MDNEPRPANKDPRKIILGILCVLFFLGAAAFWIWPPTGSAGQEWQAACWRVGPLLAAVWLAYDELKRLPKLLFAVPVALAIMIKWPKTAILLIPILFFLVILKMPLKRR
jgi:hypothetical protein